LILTKEALPFLLIKDITATSAVQRSRGSRQCKWRS